MTPPAAPAAPEPVAERHSPEPPPEPEPARAESADVQSAKTEPARAETARAEPAKVANAPVGGSITLSQLATDNWHQLLARLGLTGIVLNIASHCELRARDAQALDFVLDEANATLFNDSHADKLRLALENFFGEPIMVAIQVGQVGTETPAMRQARLDSERQQQAIESIENDPNLKVLMTRFDGELDRGSIVPTDA